MLVKFNSNVAGELMMFADVAKRLLTVAGKECTARGVITADQLPDIIQRLSAAAAADRAEHAPNDEEDPNVVGLARRAQPFIEFLQLTTREKDGFVLWEAASDFH